MEKKGRGEGWWRLGGERLGLRRTQPVGEWRFKLGKEQLQPSHHATGDVDMVDALPYRRKEMNRGEVGWIGWTRRRWGPFPITRISQFPSRKKRGKEIEYGDKREKRNREERKIYLFICIIKISCHH